MKLTYVREFIKARKEVIKDFDELRGRVGGRDGGEANDVCVQNAGKLLARVKSLATWIILIANYAGARTHLTFSCRDM